MPTPSAATFLSDLQEHQLLTAAQLEEAGRLAQELGPEARLLAKQLIDRAWLTPYQANQLLLGRGPSLLLGPYLLLNRIGSGGMGEVFKARHQLMDRVVALKVLRADRLTNPAALQRFQREVQVAAKLSHPNVVLAHDAGRVGDTYYLVMEFIEGIDLARLVKQRGRLPAPEACEFVREAALGLQHAHERGLVHRDVKPSNLLLATHEGVVKILDLGLARLRSSQDMGQLTQEGSLMGTPDYLAPEQAVDSAHADTRADVYSLGCTLYHLLAGQPPFPGGTLAEKILRHQQAEPHALESLCPDLPAGLGDVVRTMMAKGVEDRYQTPGQAAAALAPFASDVVAVDRAAEGDGPEAQAVAAIPVGPPQANAVIDTLTWAPSEGNTVTFQPEAPPSSLRKRPLVLITLGLAVLLIAIVMLLAVLFRQGPDGGLANHPQLKKGPEAGGGAGQPAPPPGGEAPPVPRKQGRIHFLYNLVGHTAGVQCLAFAPDGKLLASGGDDNVVHVWDTRTGKEVREPMPHPRAIKAVAWAPDGKRLAVASGGFGFDARVQLWDLADKGGPRRQFVAEKKTVSLADVRCLAFSPDGKRLAAGGGPVRLWTLEGGEEPVILAWAEGFPSYVYGLSFSPDSKRLAAGCHESSSDNVRVWDVADPQGSVLLQGNQGTFGLAHFDVRGAIASDANGNLLARATSKGTNSPEGDLKVWKVVPGKKQITWKDTYPLPGGGVFALAALPDGRFRVAVGAGSPSPFPRPLVPGKDTTVQVWEGPPTQAQPLATGHRLAVLSLALSADGRLLATGSADNLVKLWKVDP